MNWEEQSFVEQVVAGYPPAIARLVAIVVGLVIGVLIIRWLIKTQTFKVGLIVFVILLIAGFILDAETMMQSIARLADWLESQIPEA